MSDATRREGMARYGIRVDRALGGVGVPALRATGKRLGRDHELAGALWATGIHEARLLAAFVDDPFQVTEDHMEAWAAQFDSWDIVDGVTRSLFDRTPFAWIKAREWSGRPEEFVKRAAFAMVAGIAVHDKAAPDRVFRAFLPVIEREAGDPRNYVRKGVNWALRQIGKRNRALNEAAIACAERILASGERSARWVASDALRELRTDYTQIRLR
jgi:3-methyladenine DNA glycosylase AlkD